MALGRYRYLVICVIIAVLAAVFYPSEKKRISKVLKACVESVTDEDISRLMEHISYNYRDDHGGSYLILKKRAETVFRRFDDFAITADVMNITVDREKAEADLRVSIIATEAGMRGYFIGDAEKAAEIMVHLEKSPYEWKIMKVDYINDGAVSNPPLAKGGRGDL
ncbi:MAG: hypothetical protein AB1499_03820 [Nitrospirota bacterium]